LGKLFFWKESFPPGLPHLCLSPERLKGKKANNLGKGREKKFSPQGRVSFLGGPSGFLASVEGNKKKPFPLEGRGGKKANPAGNKAVFWRKNAVRKGGACGQA